MSLIRVSNRMPYAVGGVPANAMRDVAPEIIAAHPWAFVVQGAVEARYEDKREKPAKDPATVKDAAKIAEKAEKPRGPGRPPKVKPDAEKAPESSEAPSAPEVEKAPELAPSAPEGSGAP